MLVMNEDPKNKLMIQIRLEQPDDTLCMESHTKLLVQNYLSGHSHVNATVITGVAIQDGDGSILQVIFLSNSKKPKKKLLRLLLESLCVAGDIEWM